MKSIFLFIFTFLLLTACQQNYIPRNSITIKIDEFKQDSTSIRAIIAINSNTVHYAGSNGDIGFTKDAGKTWTVKKIVFQDSIKPHFRSLATNGNSIFALSIANPALLYKIKNDESKLVYQENHERVFYDALQFFEDGIHGIAVGDPTENCASIIITSDGGQTWQKISCDKLPFFDKEEAFFAASNTNIKTLGKKVWIGSGGKKARILFSDNYGETWQIFNTPIIQGNGPQGIYSIDFFDEKTGIAIGGNYAKPTENYANIATTSDGGKTWKVVANGKNAGYKSCVQYIPDTQGKELLAVGITGISFSNDGGNSWKKISDEQYYSIQFIDKNTAWLSGAQKIGKLSIH
ncbi:WD40/YVTN/BNR-like repeat-containing protein [Polaribacter gangjinensis]|uniref:Oxidoreductase n=1 Tax=Polaribacter gangjinensis TaxID=574710 RepID=A0A2S7WA00_9FLAO|nr:oxidoreductase [Polaribacter gangjinensis]PQJ74449.1 oxidoreductase [Polaribacter gangjinensis]